MLRFVVGDRDGTDSRSGEVVDKAEEGAAGVCEEMVAKAQGLCASESECGWDVDPALVPMSGVVIMLKLIG